MRIPDDLKDCVVFIGVASYNGIGVEKFDYHATGFFVAVPLEGVTDNWAIYLVTAKHVARKLDGVDFAIRLNRKDGGSLLITSTPDVKWSYHPTNEFADVAALQVWTADDWDVKHLYPKMFIDDERVKKLGIGGGDDVAIIGLFSAMHGQARNYPIVRMGTVAMMPDEPIYVKIVEGEIEGNSLAFLIEARSTGGLSGSPVFVFKDTSIYLLGLMHGHWDLKVGSIVDTLEIDAVNQQAERVNMGIANVVPAQFIRETLEQPDLVKSRAEALRLIQSELAPTPD